MMFWLAIIVCIGVLVTLDLSRPRSSYVPNPKTVHKITVATIAVIVGGSLMIFWLFG